MTTSGVSLLGPSAIAVALLWSAPALHAQSTNIIYVSAVVDDLVLNGNCTLREAIIAANTDTAVDRCPAGSDSDTIVLPAGTYLLSLTGPGEDGSRTGDLDIGGRVTVRGAGAARTVIDGGAGRLASNAEPYMILDRVIHVLAGGDVTLSGLTVQGGACSSGGGIFNSNVLEVQDSTIQFNDMTWDAWWCGDGAPGGAGIYNAGRLKVLRSAVWYNRNYGSGVLDELGGGLMNHGAALVDRSVFLQNWAGGAGAIWNGGDLEVRDSQLTSNFARFYGAGLENRGRALVTRSSIDDGDGGGILNWSSGVLSIVNSTVSRNFSWRGYTGIDNRDGGTVEIVSSSIVHNSVLDYQGPSGVAGPVRLMNTIVADNQGGDCTVSVTSLGNNLDSDGSCGLIGPGDLAGTDPMLGPLADNGGPTPTYALLPGSPAIDRISTDWCTAATDQRGVARPRNHRGLCDIGAYEFSPPGDVGLLEEDVKALFKGGWLSKEREAALIALLKDARSAASVSDSWGACAGLDQFSAMVAQYSADGNLASEAAQHLLAGAGRITAMICP